jgi:2-methylaconitate isomerase
MSDQLTIRCVLMRGGTSKGLYFHEADLPEPGARRDRLLRRLMGSPDVLQIDGLGGSRPITSKVAIIRPSERADADVDYTFAQVDIAGTAVIYHGNCGNISSGVGPFAIDEGLVPATEPVTTVRIHNTNTNALLVADVPVRDGRARVTGDYAIAGVPGTGAEIRMNWRDTVGAKTGRLLPTGNVLDELELDSGARVRFTLCDAANPVLWVSGSDLGAGYDPTMTDPLTSPELAGVLREVRGRVGARLGMLADWRDIDGSTDAVRLLGVVSGPASYRSLNGTRVSSADMDLRVHVIFMDRLHESVPGTGSVSLAAASRVTGSVVHAVTANLERDVLRIGHPSGVTQARVRASSTDAEPYVEFEDLGFSRTARRLADTRAYYPADTLEETDAD